ncbi:pilus assembly protein TadG-related protein [Kiritimatiellaeota bacterium B1221]|nr:pilus assembly protein TadG-related protein [Kiritimatiellaeota bacterium B1221]
MSQHTRETSSKSGQALIFMCMVVVMMAFAALFYFDIHKTLAVKARGRNAGDAAALAGARWEAVSLNLIGSLNIAKAVTLTDALTSGQTTSPEADLITDLQRRISFSGPLLGYAAAQQAAKQNGIFNNEEYARLMRGEISDFESLLNNNPPRFTPSGTYASATDELLAMMSMIPDQGMAVRAFPQYPPLPNHLLLNPDFYDAVSGRNWCWFYYNAYSELVNYSDWASWDWGLDPALIDAIFHSLPIRSNSPYFTLWLQWLEVKDSLPVLPVGSTWEDTFDDLQSALTDLENQNPTAYADLDVTMALYNQPRWASWNSYTGPDFPWDGDIKAEYDYLGAESAVLLEPQLNRRTDIQNHEDGTSPQVITRTAAAKPFGYLEDENGDLITPNTHLLVLPAYHDIRLIPMGASLNGSSNLMRSGWIEFVRDILPLYLDHGPSVLDSGNYFSRQLIRWEEESFHSAGTDWLDTFSGNCTQPTPGGSGGGGTNHGH